MYFECTELVLIRPHRADYDAKVAQDKTHDRDN